MAEEIVKCEVCGDEDTEDNIQIFHRGCRLKAAFPDCYTRTESGFLAFDVKKIAEKLKIGKPTDETTQPPDLG